MENTLKIALFTDTFTPDVNGVALTLNRFVKHLHQTGHEVLVFAPDSKNKEAGGEGEPVHRYMSFPFILYPELQAAVANPIDVYAKLDKFQPDIIHVATPFNLGLIGRRYALKYDIPFVASYHTNFDQYLSAYKLKWAKNILDSYTAWFHEKCQAVYAPSQVTADELRAKGYPNVQIWARGVEYDRFKPAENKADKKKDVLEQYNLDPNKKTILYVGRLAAEKSIHVLMEVAKEYKNREDIQFLLVGDGPIRKQLEEEVSRDQLPVYSLGFKEKDELADLYSAADIFFFPSTTETFGNVVLEALSSGVPVIGANSGGVKTLVNPGVSGYLCIPDNIGDFHHTLEYLLNNEDLRLTFGQAARKFAESQSWSSIFNKLVDSYRNVIEDDEYKEVL